MKSIAEAAAKQANHEQKYSQDKRNPALSETHEILDEYSEEAIRMAAEEVEAL